MVHPTIFFDSISALLSLAAGVYALLVSTRMKGKLRTSMLLFSLAIIVTITVHSILSLLTDSPYITMPVLMRAMSIQVFAGSLIFIIATAFLYHAIRGIGSEQQEKSPSPEKR